MFSRTKFEVLYTRYEYINFYVFILSILRNCFRNIVENYKKTYFELVSPKIIYCAIDNLTAFYKLKNIYPHAKFVVDQYGIAKITGEGWPNKFYWDIKRYNLKREKARADVLFVFGQNEKDRLQKIINGKYYILGNTRNNARIIKSNKKKKEITYICSGLWQPSWNKQIKIFKIVSNYCADNNIILNFIPKALNSKKLSNEPYSPTKRNLIVDGKEIDESYYRTVLGGNNWKYFDHKKRDVYNFCNEQELIYFFTHYIRI